jgi:hypothetical protein
MPSTPPAAASCSRRRLDKPWWAAGLVIFSPYVESVIASDLLELSPFLWMIQSKKHRNYKHCAMLGQNKDETLAAKAVDKPPVNEIIMGERGCFYAGVDNSSKP